MKKHVLPAAAAGLASLLLSLLAGCAEPSTPASRSPSASPATVVAGPSPIDALRKGMTDAEVRGLAGEPAEIKPFRGGEFHSEVWVYRRVVSEEVRPVVVRTQNVPVANPLTGQVSSVAEPVMSNEFIKVSETVELLMIDGRLIEWKRKPQVDRRIY